MMADASTASLLPAVIGLTGVLIGGLITAGANYILAIRKERHDLARETESKLTAVLVARRLVATELVTIRITMESSIDGGVWYRGNKLSSQAWEEHRRTLAAGLDWYRWAT